VRRIDSARDGAKQTMGFIASEFQDPNRIDADPARRQFGFIYM
jgi:hypothetical protein